MCVIRRYQAGPLENDSAVPSQEDDEAEREMQAEIEAERLQGAFSVGSKCGRTFNEPAWQKFANIRSKR